MHYAPYKFISFKKFITSIPDKDPLPHRILKKSLGALPDNCGLVKRDKKGNIKEVSRDLLISISRVLETDFTKEYWHLENPRDTLDTVFWTIAGGSFIADFSMDPSKPRIFAWGLPLVKEASYYSLETLKGRNPREVPTAACLPPEEVYDFVDTKELPSLTREDIVHYFSAGPLGIRVKANNKAPKHLVNSKTGLIQFILSGQNSPYMNLVRLYLNLSKFPMMGITSGNYSSHGPKASLNRGTHHTLTKVMENMGTLGIPILAGPVHTSLPKGMEYNIEEAYELMNKPYLDLTPEKLESFKENLLPLSVTISEIKKHPKGHAVFEIKRHGSLHYDLLREHITKRLNGEVVLDEDINRLVISNY